MISKNKLKELSVYKQQKRCEADAVFVVEGVKMCGEALAAKAPIKVVCATNLWLSQHPELPKNAEIHEVEDVALSRLSHMPTPNEVWMLLDRQLPPAPRSDHGLTLALDHLQDPGNLGTIIRTADWFGVRRIVCSNGTVSCFNPKVVQSTMGSLFRTEVLYADLPSYLASCGLPVVGALLDGQNLWGSPSPLPSLSSGSVLVVGNEGRGLTPQVRECVTAPSPSPTSAALPSPSTPPWPEPSSWRRCCKNRNAATPRLRPLRCYSYLKSEKQSHWRINSLTVFHVQNPSDPKTPVQRSFYIESILKER